MVGDRLLKIRWALALIAAVAVGAWAIDLSRSDEDSWAAIRVLDPQGRLWLEPQRLEVFFQASDGSTSRSASLTLWNYPVFTFDERPGEGEVIVLAPGCLPARVPLAKGESIVRLTAGISVVLEAAEHPMFDHEHEVEFGVGLERKATFAPGGRARRLRAAPAGAIGADRELDSLTATFPEGGRRVRLEVPGPGRYSVSWAAGLPRRSIGGSGPSSLDITADDHGRVFVVQPGRFAAILDRSLAERDR